MNVLVGDHGEALGSHGEGTHGFFVYDYALHVPFVVAAPFDALRGVRVESQVSLVDVFPTVLALAGCAAAPEGTCGAGHACVLTGASAASECLPTRGGTCPCAASCQGCKDSVLVCS